MSTAQLCAMASTGTDRVPTPVPRGNTQGVGRGRGFVPARPGQDVGSGTLALTTGSLGDGRAGLAPADGRKRPISSPPLRFPSQIKNIMPPVDSGRCSELSCSDLSQSLLRRIDEFFDGGRTIFYNGLNQVKIQCESREDANTLVRSQDLMRGGVKLFIPSSLIRKKAFTGPIDFRYSASNIVYKLDPEIRDVMMSVRRRINDEGSVSTRVEFTLAVARVPRSIRLHGYSYPLTPVIPPPRRCFTCQRFRHISNQYRSSRPICEFCSEHHRTDSCPNKLRSAFCSNCCGDHVASSREFPVYRYEFEINKYCYWNSCGFGEAELGLRERGVLRPGRRLELGTDRIFLEDPPSVLHEIDLGFSVSASQPSVSGSAVEGVTPRYARSTSNRFNIKNVDWVRFREVVDEGLLSLSLALDSCSDPAALYSDFFALITGALERCGAYRPSSLPGKRRFQPLWWNSECNAAIARRRDALREYIACQTRDERAACRRIDGEVKRFLRKQKHLSFVSFCESIDPSLGLTRIWRTVKSMSSQVAGYRTGPGTDPDSPALGLLGRSWSAGCSAG